MDHEKRGKGVSLIPSGEGFRSLRVRDELVTYKVTGSQTGGAYSIFEILTRPGDGPQPRINHRQDAAFYVLEGTYEFAGEGVVAKADPGSLVFVRRGSPHSYKNVGDGPGKILAVHTPGGPQERFFEEIGEQAELSGPPIGGARGGFVALAAAAARYGIEIPPTEGGRDAR